MELKAAIEQARLILEEEEQRPTINYLYVSPAWPMELIFEQQNLTSQGYGLSAAGVLALRRNRDKKRPRDVHERANDWAFESTNYGLLMVIFGQMPSGNRPLFVKTLLTLTADKHVPHIQPIKAPFPSWNGHASALPLVAEFCIRNNCLTLLIEALDEAKLPNPSIAGMLRELEEMISVNFDVFSDAELEAMPKALAKSREMAEQQTWSSRRARPGGPQWRTRNSGKAFRESAGRLSRVLMASCSNARRHAIFI
jgi:hypothetical protein